MADVWVADGRRFNNAQEYYAYIINRNMFDNGDFVNNNGVESFSQSGKAKVEKYQNNVKATKKYLNRGKARDIGSIIAGAAGVGGIVAGTFFTGGILGIALTAIGAGAIAGGVTTESIYWKDWMGRNPEVRKARMDRKIARLDRKIAIKQRRLEMVRERGKSTTKLAEQIKKLNQKEVNFIQKSQNKIEKEYERQLGHLTPGGRKGVAGFFDQVRQSGSNFYDFLGVYIEKFGDERFANATKAKLEALDAVRGNGNAKLEQIKNNAQEFGQINGVDVTPKITINQENIDKTPQSNPDYEEKNEQNIPPIQEVGPKSPLVSEDVIEEKAVSDAEKKVIKDEIHEVDQQTQQEFGEGSDYIFQKVDGLVPIKDESYEEQKEQPIIKGPEQFAPTNGETGLNAGVNEVSQGQGIPLPSVETFYDRTPEQLSEETKNLFANVKRGSSKDEVDTWVTTAEGYQTLGAEDEKLNDVKKDFEQQQQAQEEEISIIGPGVIPTLDVPEEIREDAKEKIVKQESDHAQASNGFTGEGSGSSKIESPTM